MTRSTPTPSAPASPTLASRSSTCGRWPRSTAGASTARSAAATSPAPSRSRRRGSPASTRTRSRTCSARRASSTPRRSSSMAPGPMTHWGSRRPCVLSGSARSASTSPVGPRGRPTRRCRSSVFRTTRRSCTPGGCASSSTAAGPKPPRMRRWLLFHVNFGVPEEYLDSHLPGALYLDTNRLEDPADWNRRSPEELDATLRALGHHRRHDGRAVRPRHRGSRRGEVAGPPRRTDRRHAARR